MCVCVCVCVCVTVCLLPCVAVTVYVRKEDEVVYNAIMLDQLSVQEFSVKVSITGMNRL